MCVTIGISNGKGDYGMKRKMIALFIGVCLLCTACTGADKQKTEALQNQQEEQQKEQAVTNEVPEIIYSDYSQGLTEEENGTLLLSVEENCPIITLKGNEEAQNRMNRVFEQQHARNEGKIDSDFNTADSDYSGLYEEELGQWSAYKYTYLYEDMYASSKILSIKASQKEELGIEQFYQDVVAYTFYVPEGKLLTLSDIFIDYSGARAIVEQYIRDVVTGEAYAAYLLEDYESYISDILTEDVFYLNEQGLVIICNADMLTTQEAGVIEISVPYEALKDVMNEQYLP